MSKIIELQKITHIYNKENAPTIALNDINLSIKEGEFIAIQGPSGSGKSTLLSIMAGLEFPTKGKVIIDKQNINSLDEKSLSEFRLKKIGFIFQSFNLIEALNVLYNVELPLIFMKIKKEKRKEKATQLLKKVGLSHRINHKVFQLSGGEKQRVAIARALINNPKIIFADEPTGNLDTKTGNEIVNLLLNINKKSKITIIMVTHNTELSQFADRIIYLKDGKIISDEKKEFFMFKSNIEMINSLSHQLISISQIDILFHMIINLFINVSRAERCSIMTYNKKNKKLEIIASKGLSKNIIEGVKLKIGEGIAGKSFKEKKIIYVKDTSTSPSFKKVDENIKYIKESLVSIPIIYQNEVLGVITLTNSLKEKYSIRYDTLLLKKISKSISITFYNINKYKEKIYDSETELFNFEYIKSNLREEAKKFLENQIPFTFMMIKFSHNTVKWNKIKLWTSSIFREQDIIGVYKKYFLSCIFPNTPIQNVSVIIKRIKKKLKNKNFIYSATTWKKEFSEIDDIINSTLKKIKNG